MKKTIKVTISGAHHNPKSPSSIFDALHDFLSSLQDIEDQDEDDDDDDTETDDLDPCDGCPMFGDDFDMDTFVSTLYSLRHDIDTLLSCVPKEEDEEDDDDDDDDDDNENTDKTEENDSFESRLTGITKHNIHIANDVDSPSYDLFLTALRFIALDINDKIPTHGYGVSPIGKVLEIEEGDNVAADFPLFLTKEDLHKALTLLIPAFQKVFPFAVRHEQKS